MFFIMPVAIPVTECYILEAEATSSVAKMGGRALLQTSWAAQL